MKAMHKIAGLTIGLGLALSAPVALGMDNSPAALKAEAKITQSEAQSTAMAKVPNGAVTSSELEREGGELVWSFDITSPSSKEITEIQVDAKTGAIVSNKMETQAQQAKEAKTDKDAMKSMKQ